MCEQVGNPLGQALSVLQRAWANLVLGIPPKQIEDVLLAYSPKSLAATKPEAKKSVVVLEINCGKPVTSVFGELGNLDVVLVGGIL